LQFFALLSQSKVETGKWKLENHKKVEKLKSRKVESRNSKVESRKWKIENALPLLPTPYTLLPPLSSAIRQLTDSGAGGERFGVIFLKGNRPHYFSPLY
jgi:hypothetical protein